MVGTYSSTYVASAVALLLGVSKEDLMTAPKEEKDSEAAELELQRLFHEHEAKLEVRAAAKGKRLDHDEDAKDIPK